MFSSSLLETTLMCDKETWPCSIGAKQVWKYNWRIKVDYCHQRHTPIGQLTEDLFCPGMGSRPPVTVNLQPYCVQVHGNNKAALAIELNISAGALRGFSVEKRLTAGYIYLLGSFRSFVKAKSKKSADVPSGANRLLVLHPIITIGVSANRGRKASVMWETTID